MFVVDTGVFETVVEERGGTSSDNDAIYANHLFATVIHEDDNFGTVVFGDADNFGIGNDSDAEFAGEKIGDRGGDIFVFARKDVVGALHNNDADAKHGKIFGDFNAGRATASYKDKLGWTTEAKCVIGVEIFNGFKTGNFAGFERGASSKDKIFGSISS